VDERTSLVEGVQDPRPFGETFHARQ
jgi:hypothetical protein